jgi:hypothetical protein
LERRRLAELAATDLRACGTRGRARRRAAYDLRHSFVSLLLLEGANVVEVARQAGHSPTVTLSRYAHLFEELEGAERHSAEDEIRRAKRLVRRTRFVPETVDSSSAPSEKSPANPGEPTPGLEPGTPSLRVKCSTS